MSIIRIDNAKTCTHGWQARGLGTVPGQSQRGYSSRFFADRKHGGKRKAFEAARAAERKLMRGAKA